MRLYVFSLAMWLLLIGTAHAASSSSTGTTGVATASSTGTAARSGSSSSTGTTATASTSSASATAAAAASSSGRASTAATGGASSTAGVNGVSSTGSSSNSSNAVIPRIFPSDQEFYLNPNSANMLDYLQNRHMHVAAVASVPLAMYSNITHTWSGFAVEVFDQTMKALIASNPSLYNFTYDFYKVTGADPFGAYNASDPSNWGPGSIVQDQIDQNAQGGALTMVIEAPRVGVMDFSAPYLQLAARIIILKGKPAPSEALSFLKVFSPDLWYTLVGCIFAVALGSWILSKCSPYVKSTDKQGWAAANIWSSWNVLLMGNWDTSKSWSTKILLLYFVFMSIIISASYTANLAAVLTAGQVKDPISGLDELISKKVPWCAEVGTVYNNVLAQSSSLAATWVSGPALTDCFAKLRAGTVTAVIGFSTQLDYYLTQSPCDLKVAGDPFAKKLTSFQFPLNFHIVFPLDEFNRQLNGLIANQVVDGLYNKYYVEQGTCGTSDTVTGVQAMQVADLVGLFYILPIAFGCGVGMIIIEWCVFLLKRFLQQRGITIPVPLLWLHQFLDGWEAGEDEDAVAPVEKTNGEESDEDGHTAAINKGTNKRNRNKKIAAAATSENDVSVELAPVPRSSNGKDTGEQHHHPVKVLAPEGGLFGSLAVGHGSVETNDEHATAATPNSHDNSALTTDERVLATLSKMERTISSMQQEIRNIREEQLEYKQAYTKALHSKLFRFSRVEDGSVDMTRSASGSLSAGAAAGATGAAEPLRSSRVTPRRNSGEQSNPFYMVNSSVENGASTSSIASPSAATMHLPEGTDDKKDPNCIQM